MFCQAEVKYNYLAKERAYKVFCFDLERAAPGQPALNAPPPKKKKHFLDSLKARLSRMEENISKSL